jgi:TolB protein
MRPCLFAACLAASLLAQTTEDLGIFEGQSDVGNPELKGSGTFDSTRREYRVTGGGANIWAKADEFHFVWRRLTGDVALSATPGFAEAGGAGHRKIGLMIRQSLAPDAPYVDAMVHGDGLTALQFRETAGDITRSVRFTVVAPARIKLERRGPLFTLWTGQEGQPLQEAGAIPMKLSDPVYVGLVVGSHNAKAIETAVFSDVSVESLPKAAPAKKK